MPVKEVQALQREWNQLYGEIQRLRSLLLGAAGSHLRRRYGEGSKQNEGKSTSGVVSILRAKITDSGFDVSGVYGDCLLGPTLAGRFFQTNDATDVLKVDSHVVVIAVLIDGTVEVATVRQHASASTIHCLFWLTQHYSDIASKYLTAIACSPNSIQRRYAAICHDDRDLSTSRREEWALAFLTFRTEPADLLRDCEAYWSLRTSHTPRVTMIAS